MNSDTYRVIRNKIIRIVPKSPENPLGYVQFRNGQKFIPTDHELATYREMMEGPLKPDPEPSAASGSGEAQQGPAWPIEVLEPSERETLEERAEREVAGSVDQVRAAVRSASQEMLNALQIAEKRRQPAPRQKVLEMIERRLKALTEAA